MYDCLYDCLYDCCDDCLYDCCDDCLYDCLLDCLDDCLDDCRDCGADALGRGRRCRPGTAAAAWAPRGASRLYHR